MRYKIIYYPRIEVLQYPWVFRMADVDESIPSHRRPPPQRRGNMDDKSFARLKDDIAKNGIVNPFIIEFYDKQCSINHPEPGPIQCQGKRLCIMVGNNRAEAMYQLGLRYAPALFVVPPEVAEHLPKTLPHRIIPANDHLVEEMEKLWEPVTRDGVSLGGARAFEDSTALMETITGLKENAKRR